MQCALDFEIKVVLVLFLDNVTETGGGDKEGFVGNGFVWEDSQHVVPTELLLANRCLGIIAFLVAVPTRLICKNKKRHQK